MKINFNIRKIKAGDYVTDKWDRWVDKHQKDKICIYQCYYTYNNICKLRRKHGHKIPYDYSMENLKIIIPQKGSKYIKR